MGPNNCQYDDSIGDRGGVASNFAGARLKSGKILLALLPNVSQKVCKNHWFANGHSQRDVSLKTWVLTKRRLDLQLHPSTNGPSTFRRAHLHIQTRGP